MTQDSPQVALDALELWVGDRDRTADLLTATFGFVAIDRDDEFVCLSCGGATVVLRHGTSAGSPVDRHVTEHGDTVADVALVCADAEALVERALSHGLVVSSEGDAVRFDVTGDGTIFHSVRERPTVSGGGVEPGAPGVRGIDHVALCLRSGTAARVADTYEQVFGLERLDIGELAQVGGEETGMRSAVLSMPGGFTVVLTEPVSPNGRGQTQRFIDAHAGPGVQHAALVYDDLCAAVDALRARGADFLPAPDAYYEQSRGRLAGQPLEWEELRRLEILVDADDDGLLFQLFTRPVTERGTFFFELIQRSGSTGFGANNVRALFSAVEAAMRAGA